MQAQIPTIHISIWQAAGFVKPRQQKFVLSGSIEANHCGNVQIHRHKTTRSTFAERSR